MTLTLRGCQRPAAPDVIVVHDTIVRDTTIYQPQAADTIRLEKKLFVTVPVVARDTVRDSITLALPTEQRRYTDSLYTAWVSGVEPHLDSITIRQRTVVTTITKTVTHRPRFALGIQSGAGIGIISRQPDIYLGVGIQYRLWP